jgi:hypothetical protein
LLAGDQKHFFQTNSKNTFHTARIKRGETADAKLIAPRLQEPGKEDVDYYVWIHGWDEADDIARKWSVMFWGEPLEGDPFDNKMRFFMHDGEMLDWEQPLELFLGDVIVHEISILQQVSRGIRSLSLRVSCCGRSLLGEK